MLRFVLVLVLSFSAAAAPGASANLAAWLVAAGAMDAGAAARQAAAMTGGRVLDVQHGQAGGNPVYFVKVLLDDGRVKVIRVDGVAPQSERR